MRVNCPPPLRVFLEAGCDLTAPGLPLDEMCRAVFTALPGLAPAGRMEHAAMLRSCVRALLDIEEWPGPVPQQTLVTAWSWEIELMESPELASDVVAALPARAVEEWRQQA